MARKSYRKPTLSNGGEFTFSLDNLILCGPALEFGGYAPCFESNRSVWTLAHESIHWLQTISTTFGLLIHGLHHERDLTILRALKFGGFRSLQDVARHTKRRPLVDISKSHPFMPDYPGDANGDNLFLDAVYELWLASMLLLDAPADRFSTPRELPVHLGLALRDTLSDGLAYAGVEGVSNVSLVSEVGIHVPIAEDGSAITGLTILECHAVAGELAHALRLGGQEPWVVQRLADLRGMGHMTALVELAALRGLRLEELNGKGLLGFLESASLIAWLALNPSFYVSNRLRDTLLWEDIHPGIRFLRIACEIDTDFDYHRMARQELERALRSYCNSAEVTLSLPGDLRLRAANAKAFDNAYAGPWRLPAAGLQIYCSADCLYTPLTVDSIVESPWVIGLAFDYVVWATSQVERKWDANPAGVICGAGPVLGSELRSYESGGLMDLVVHDVSLLPPIYSDGSQIHVPRRMHTGIGASIVGGSIRRTALFDIAFNTADESKWRFHELPKFLARDSRVRECVAAAFCQALQTSSEQVGKGVEARWVSPARTVD